MSDAPAYRLYTSAQAAERAGGGLTESLFERLATQGLEHTLIGAKLRWTDAQIAAAVAHHARGGNPTEQPEPPAPAPTPRTPRASRRKTPPQTTGVPDLSARPGRRYATP
ncbi:hypothetical protein [Streptosporangium sp. NPDC048865]|uniref:hypothetical protein n=1 Tax=Streptosporangium sp. NPDC048865 TaxID=3155766 RepID=UPI00341CD2B8